MPIETERKFIVTTDDWSELELIQKHYITQGYLPSGKGSTIRIRITDTKAYLTVKITPPNRANALSRYEFEQVIPLDEATELMKLAAAKLEKVRYVVTDEEGQLWEVDVFKNGLQGLILAEIELPDESVQVVTHPWLGKEVTEDRAYSNEKLAHVGLPK